MFDRRLLVNFDLVLLLSVLFIAALGAFNLYSICLSSWEDSSVFFLPADLLDFDRAYGHPFCFYRLTTLIS